MTRKLRTLRTEAYYALIMSKRTLYVDERLFDRRAEFEHEIMSRCTNLSLSAVDRIGT